MTAVVLDERGHPVFEQVSRRALMRSEKSIRTAMLEVPAAIMAFDLLYAHGENHCGLPIVVRKAALKAILQRCRRVVPVAYIKCSGTELYRQAEVLELEGVVAKRSASTYRAGRTPDWVKIKTPAGKAREAKRMEHRR